MTTITAGTTSRWKTAGRWYICDGCKDSIPTGHRIRLDVTVTPHRPVVKRVWCHKCAKTGGTR